MSVNSEQSFWSTCWKDTGEAHWLDVYDEKVHEKNDARLASVEDSLAFSATPYVVLQTAASLVPLIALERDDAIRDRYEAALRACARGMWYAIPACEAYDRARIEAAVNVWSLKSNVCLIFSFSWLF